MSGSKQCSGIVPLIEVEMQAHRATLSARLFLGRKGMENPEGEDYTAIKPFTAIAKQLLAFRWSLNVIWNSFGLARLSRL